jgi:hypothetical protein
MEKAFPTKNGMPIHVSELHLHRSHLKDRPENYSLHHHHWSARRMGGFLITQTVRDLEHEQTFMKNDQHNLGQFALHHLYAPPEPATLDQYMDRLDTAFELGEQMRIKANGKWVMHPITEIHRIQIHQEYNREAD